MHFSVRYFCLDAWIEICCLFDNAVTNTCCNVTIKAKACLFRCLKNLVCMWIFTWPTRNWFIEQLFAFCRMDEYVFVAALEYNMQEVGRQGGGWDYLSIWENQRHVTAITFMNIFRDIHVGTCMFIFNFMSVCCIRVSIAFLMGPQIFIILQTGIVFTIYGGREAVS